MPRPVARIRWLLVLPLLFIMGTALKAQGDLRFFGTATKDGKPLSGAAVTVLMDGKQIINLTTGKNGKFKFTIDVGHSYRINFSAPGCVDMFMTMDLKVPPEKGWIYPDYVCEVPFFSPNDPKVNTDIYAKKPFIKVIYDGADGFHDDPTYRFIDEVFKNPADEAAKKAEEDRLKKEAEEKEKARLAEEERLRKLQEEQNNINNNLPPVLTQPNDPNKPVDVQPTVDPSMETDAIRLEREKQERENQTKENKTVRANYENNLLKMVAESEKKTNIEKYNRMKDEAEVNSVVSALRRQAEVKGQREFLIEKDKEKQRQTRANRQVREQQVRRLIETTAQVERDINVSGLKPVASSGPLNYIPSPHFVTTNLEGFWTDEKNIVVNWPGGKRTIFKTIKYWWACYFYIDDKEVEEKIYKEKLDAYHPSGL